MQLRSWKIRISDIIEAIENVLEYSEEMTFESFVTELRIGCLLLIIDHEQGVLYHRY